MPSVAALYAHLASGATTVCRAWEITRRDGLRLGFTDHDGSLSFDGMTFRADSGLSSGALDQASGLAVDNVEAVGVLSDDGIRAEDLAAGLYDGARLTCWQVNWADPEARRVLFRGELGDIRLEGAAFHAEVRGLAEALNQPQGRAFQAPCGAVLGDAACGVDLTLPAYRHEGALLEIDADRRLWLGDLGTYAAGWFQRGRVTVLDGAGAQQTAAIKHDHVKQDGRRWIELVQPLALTPEVGALIRLEAGCDKRFATCRDRFSNVLNFRGFPDVPSEDWVYVHPSQSAEQGGGSRR